MWDNAYAVHHLTSEQVTIKNLLQSCKESANPNRVFTIASTSKVSFAGAGVAAIGCSADNISWLEQHCSVQTIGSDKLNQLRHVKFFKNLDGIKMHMTKHAAILGPKFDKVQTVLNDKLAGLNIATWSNPKGGYFVNLDVQNGCAKKVVAMAREAGVIMTAAGATFPYQNDPKDCNIRIAPSLPALDDIELAMNILCVCIALVTIDKLSSS